MNIFRLIDEEQNPKLHFRKCLDKQEFSYVHLYWFFSLQFPIMLENDAISRYYGLEKGQVVKITYKGGISDSLVTYRCVSWCLLKHSSKFLCGKLFYSDTHYRWNEIRSILNLFGFGKVFDISTFIIFLYRWSFLF